MGRKDGRNGRGGGAIKIGRSEVEIPMDCGRAEGGRTPSEGVGCGFGSGSEDYRPILFFLDGEFSSSLARFYEAQKRISCLLGVKLARVIMRAS